MHTSFFDLFLNLLLAHLLADFPFQPDAMFRLKCRARLGVLLHAVMFFLAATPLLLPMLFTAPALIMLGTLTLVHFWIDETKLQIFQRREIDNIWLFLADQALHFSSLFMGAWLFVIRESANASPLHFSFSRNAVVVLLGMLVSSYCGVLITHYMEKMFLGRKYHNENLRAEEKYYGMMGRMAVTSAFLAKGWIIWALVGSLIFLFLLSLRLKGWRIQLVEFFLTSAAVASLVGMFLWF